MTDVKHAIDSLKEESWWQQENGDAAVARLMKKTAELLEVQQKEITVLKGIAKHASDHAVRARSETVKIILAEVRTAWDTTHYNEEFEEKLNSLEAKYEEEGS